MEINNPIFCRQSVRRFSEQPVDAETLLRLLKAGMQAPSARNEQPWQFIVVRDSEKRKAVAEVHAYAGPAARAPLVLLLLANLAITRNDKNEFWPQDMAACTQNILLQAAAEDLGAVWLGMYPAPERTGKLREIFSLPPDIMPFCVIALGYPMQEQTPPKSRFNPAVIFENRYECRWEDGSSR